MTVLGHNTLGGALFDGHVYSRDLLRLVFLEPDAREFYPDWERVAANTVGGLRAAAGTDFDDPRLIEVVEKACAQECGNSQVMGTPQHPSEDP